tara:strand:+ start:494 stop:631 length:138 start_codon:yes stop_codon:yes gene_type:complete
MEVRRESGKDGGSGRESERWRLAGRGRRGLEERKARKIRSKRRTY